MRTVEEPTAPAAVVATAPARTVRSGRALLLTWAPIALVAVGIALRLVRFLADRSLWLDESLLSINLMTRSYRDLLETLDYNQGAPIGFLWAERLALDLFGDSELALRLFPLLVGLASLALFYLVARELLATGPFLIAVALFATMEPFIRYSAEVKQYGLDVAVSLALVYLFARILERPELDARRTVLLGLAGPLAVWFSHPSVFVLTGIAAAGLYIALKRANRRALIQQAIAYCVWLLSFLVVYLVAIRDLHDLQGTVRGVGSGSSGRLKNLYTIFNDPGGFPRTAVGLAAAVSLVGVLYLWRRRPGLVVLIAVTTSSLLLAGYLGMYPVGQRFLLFLLPLVVLCLAEGAAGIGRRTPRLVAAGLLFSVMALILVPVVGSAGKRLVAPPKIEETESLLAEIASNWRAGDVLYLGAGSQYAFRYYTECQTCSAVSGVARSLWPSHPTEGGQAQTTAAIVSDSPRLVVAGSDALDVGKLAGRNRVWLLYTHFFPRTEEAVLADADREGTRIRCTHGGAALLCLYDFSHARARSEP